LSLHTFRRKGPVTDEKYEFYLEIPNVEAPGVSGLSLL